MSVLLQLSLYLHQKYPNTENIQRFSKAVKRSLPYIELRLEAFLEGPRRAAKAK
jgi:hypothetical protein